MEKYMSENYVNNVYRKKNGEWEHLLGTAPKGGDVINAVIDSFLAKGGPIDAGAFVEFANKPIMSSSLYIGNGGSFYGCIRLDENRVFVISPARYYDPILYGNILTFKNNEITRGTEVSIFTSSTSSNSVTPAGSMLLDDSRILVTFADMPSTSIAGTTLNLKGCVLTINGDTVTVGTVKTIVSADGACLRNQLIQLDSSKALLLHTCGTWYLYGMVLTVSGTTISTGTDTVIGSDKYSGQDVSAALVNTNTVFISHTAGWNEWRLHGIVVTISGTTISKGTDTLLDSENGSGSTHSTVSYKTNKALTLYRKSDALYGITHTVSGTTFTHGDPFVVSSDLSGSLLTRSLPEDGTFWLLSADSSKVLHLLKMSIKNDTTIETLSDTPIVENSSLSTYGDCYGFAELGNGNYFITYSTGGGYAIGMNEAGEKLVQPSITKIDGLTKTIVTPEEEGEVYILSN